MTSTERSPRNTRQRAEVRDAMAASDAFATSQEIHDRMRRDGSKVGLATVYRALQTMAAGGEVDTIRTPDGQIAYRTCTPGHHHHLVCRVCGRTVEIDLPGLEETTRGIAGEYGFTELDHEVEFFGVCAGCHS
jgi:Fur family ferric uptake transcriptional regulator